MAKIANSKKIIRGFITQCTLVFKSYDYNVVESKNKQNLWHFSVTKDDKKYVVYCTNSLEKVQGIIKIALKKLPEGTRLVVICNDFTDEDRSKAEASQYTITSLGTIKQYGVEMLDAKQRAQRQAS
ncbi:MULTISPECIES: hypothetical protein [Halobacteriovorax]|uniref:Uncharacterized protein n=1 Tax=Halobacteriovorax vibrionivorans TaxID=2152716 RepID=A0ABY0IE16_9BACT|nr:MULTISPECIES: hypothetical protein [Halobacteriovorax]AYF44781.1 hypothetical protein BALOs_1781 [Halobacteriovorax sp. BALOs_7]RZF20862.1 hypothetical protein DAY19_12830 [Halobacteriovorax vibrionivorans]TGD48246.1 hypothetical protein EP118_04930 [Halobacteriovorax sp. Y22]